MFGWQRRHNAVNGQVCCIVKVKTDNGEWIEKEDVGTESNTEAVKGQFSDSFKRACFNLGIGRELYTSPKIFITLDDKEMVQKNGKWTVSPKVVFTVTEIGYDGERNINALTIVDNNGVVRYKMGQPVSAPKADDGGISFAEQMEGFIKPALEQARTEEDVKRIWDDYASYQNNPEFVAAVTARLGVIRNAA